MPTRSKARKEEPAEAGSDIVMEEAPTSHQPESKDDDMSVDQDGNEEVEEAEDDEFEEEEEVQRVKLVCEKPQ
jgi:DNA-directed RNA polymerase I and III subunit RPAC2